MKKEWHSKLPRTGLLSGLIMIILLILAVVFKPSAGIESNLNRKEATDRLKEITIENKDAFNSSAYIDYVNKTLDSPVINTRWLIDDEGVIVYAGGMMAGSTPLNTSIYTLADNKSLGWIHAVEENMDAVQKKILYAAAAIRREGDHNDVTGHIVMPLRTGTGELAGFVGIAFNLDNSVQPAIIYVVDILLIISFLVYWLSFPLWVYSDCRKNDNKYIFWTLFVLIGNLPAFIAYIITKKEGTQR